MLHFCQRPAASAWHTRPNQWSRVVKVKANTSTNTITTTLTTTKNPILQSLAIKGFAGSRVAKVARLNVANALRVCTQGPGGIKPSGFPHHYRSTVL